MRKGATDSKEEKGQEKKRGEKNMNVGNLAGRRGRLPDECRSLAVGESGNDSTKGGETRQ